jgi:DDE superfamily endonuclease/Winged helix-turn helix
MPRKRNNPVSLSGDERGKLESLISGGHASARQLTHARILLKADEGEDSPHQASSWPDTKIAHALEISRSTVARVRERFAWEGLEAALVHRRPKAHQTEEARWRAGGASDRSGLLGASERQKALERASSGRAFRSAGVRRRAHLPRACKAHSQKSAIKPWLKGQWSIPPKQDASFVWRMEDVLEVYTRPYEERFPQVCLDEKSKQLVGEVREPLAVLPGRPARYDYEYERNGTANLFIISEPLAGWRHISVTERRTKIDWAHCIKELVDLHYPEAEKIVLVLDNLNTHTPGALYEAFTPTEARRIAKNLEIHYTPKHGSWLNMAEIELSVLARQCLDQRIPDQQTLAEEVGAWEAERNAAESSIEWRFTTQEARIKLKHLYPEIVEPSNDSNHS